MNTSPFPNDRVASLHPHAIMHTHCQGRSNVSRNAASHHVESKLGGQVAKLLGKGGRIPSHRRPVSDKTSQNAGFKYVRH